MSRGRNGDAALRRIGTSVVCCCVLQAIDDGLLSAEVHVNTYVRYLGMRGVKSFHISRLFLTIL